MSAQDLVLGLQGADVVLQLDDLLLHLLHLATNSVHQVRLYQVHRLLNAVVDGALIRSRSAAMRKKERKGQRKVITFL